MTLHLVAFRGFKRKLMILPLVTLIMCACLCPYNPYTNQFTTQEPKIDSLAGIYLLKQQTLTVGGLGFLNDNQATIELHSDGTFSAANFPQWEETNSGSYRFAVLKSTKGVWHSETAGGVSDGNESDLKMAWQIVFEPPLSNAVANLGNNQKPYRLIFTYGDGDSGTVMFFDQSNGQHDERINKVPHIEPSP